MDLRLVENVLLRSATYTLRSRDRLARMDPTWYRAVQYRVNTW